MYRRFHRPQNIQGDPLSFAHRYPKPKDRELVAFLSALCAYGNVRAILGFLETFLSRLEASPSERLMNASRADLKELSARLVYRFYRPEDFYDLLRALQGVLRDKESLEAVFLMSQKSAYVDRLDDFLAEIKRRLPSLSDRPGLRFMLPDILRGAAKRIHLFMRWVVRSDGLDLGLWNSVSCSELLIPLDVHIFRASRSLGICSRSTPDLLSVFEITENLQKIDPTDPIRFDFALCHAGIQGFNGEESVQKQSLRAASKLQGAGEDREHLLL